MALSKGQIEDTLGLSDHAAEALRGLYQALKQANPKTSLSLICRKANIPSKGYLSDVMSGRRLLNMAYSERTAQALGLRGLHAKYLGLLIERDHALSERAKEKITSDMSAIRKSFSIVMSPTPLPLEGNHFAVEFCCAFGLFGGTPRIENLIEHFGSSRSKEIYDTLNRLKEAGHIYQDQGTLHLRAGHTLFSSENNEESHLHFLEQALDEGKARAKQWYQNRSLAHFESIVISVRKGRYMEILQKIKSELLRWQADLETPDADLLIRFNVQIYPAQDPIPTK